MSSLISGGYSDGAPPLPIPNREVKPVRADGTASSGRVGSRRFFPEESGIPHNVECRISDLYNLHDPHEGGSPDKAGGEIPQTKRKVIHLHHEHTRTFSIGAVDSAIRDTFKL